jgi:hypothetical protein
VREWTTCRYRTNLLCSAPRKEPISLAAGSLPVGFALIDEIVKHAALSWVVDWLKELFGSVGVLTFIGDHPFVAYGFLVALWMVFVYSKASYQSHGGEPERQELPKQEIKQEIRDSKISGGVRQVGNVERDYIEKQETHIYHHGPLFETQSAEPRPVIFSEVLRVLPFQANDGVDLFLLSVL